MGVGNDRNSRTNESKAMQRTVGNRLALVPPDRLRGPNSISDFEGNANRSRAPPSETGSRCAFGTTDNKKGLGWHF